LKVLSIIGTRPQYIKFKPLYDTLLNDSKITHTVIDTKQHFSYNVSQKLIEDLNIKIDYSLDCKNLNEITFITSCMTKLSDRLDHLKPDLVIVFGDTNTTLCASIVAHKKNIAIAHIEAGERSNTLKPEEINRQYCDSVSAYHFCSAFRHMDNVSNPIYAGDLEYEFLNIIDPKIEYKDFGFMTLHRQENMHVNTLKDYFNFIKKIPMKLIFPVHHRTRKFIDDNAIELPNNVETCNSMSYTEAVKTMSKCKFMITDSGGVQKCSPFFGKKCLVLRVEGDEWKETYRSDYSKKIYAENSYDWLINEWNNVARDKYFYCSSGKYPSKIIRDTLRKI